MSGTTHAPRPSDARIEEIVANLGWCVKKLQDRVDALEAAEKRRARDGKETP